MHKKKADIHPGARVRVADPLLSGDERWTHARAGVVHKMNGDRAAGVQVLLDGETDPTFIAWPDLDVEQKPRPKWQDLPVGLIRPSRWQYRHTFAVDSMLELADSIRRSGLINRPLVFRDEEGGYELIAGERRLRAIAAIAITDLLSTSLEEAVKLACAGDFWDEKRKLLRSPGAQAHTVPVEIRPGEAADFREIVILENLQREDPSPVEEAEGFKVLLDEEGYSQAALAKRLGKSQPYVAQRLSLLGLGADARAAVAEHDVSFSAARAIAAVPAPVQAALTRHVVEMNKTAADGGTTSRQVQAMATQLKRFLDPEAWTPDPAHAMAPRRRNYMRLVAHLLSTLSQAKAEAILSLRHDDSSYRTNLLGRAPLALATDWGAICEIVRALAGKETTVDTAWRQASLANGWICAHCQLRGADRPEGDGREPCQNWVAPGTAATCLGFIGPDDPLVLPVSYDHRDAAGKLGIQVLECAGEHYVDDPAAYVSLVDGHARLKREREAQHKQAQSQAHLVDLRAYWAAQNETRTLIEQDAAGELGRALVLDHPQAHACRRCVHFVHRHGNPDDLPPCRFADHPVKRAQWGGPAAPGMGVLVRDDGLMVPRCERFRVESVPDLFRLEGIHFPEAARPHVLDWLDSAARVHNSYAHNNTLVGVLSWLPYRRDEEKQIHDREKMVRWVRDHWDDLGDGAVAALLSIARDEAIAGGKYQEPLELRNPHSGALERWCSIEWETFVLGKYRYSYGKSLPSGWPEPFLRQEKPAPAPASNRLIDIVTPAEDPDMETDHYARNVEIDEPDGETPTAMWAPQPKNPYLAHYWTCDPEIRLWESACGQLGHGDDGNGGNWQPTENDVIKRCATCERAINAREES